MMEKEQDDYSTLSCSMERLFLITALVSLFPQSHVAMVPINTPGKPSVRQQAVLPAYCSKNLVTFSGLTNSQRTVITP